LYKKSVVVTILVFLSSCGGGSDPDTAPIIIVEPPVVDVQETPTGCNNEQYAIVSANAPFDVSYPPGNAIDGDSSQSSRWSSEGSHKKLPLI
jgi:hypothetical protein